MTEDDIKAEEMNAAVEGILDRFVDFAASEMVGDTPEDHVLSALATICHRLTGIIGLRLMAFRRADADESYDIAMNVGHVFAAHAGEMVEGFPPQFQAAAIVTLRDVMTDAAGFET